MMKLKERRDTSNTVLFSFPLK